LFELVTFFFLYKTPSITFEMKGPILSRFGTKNYEKRIRGVHWLWL